MKVEITSFAREKAAKFSKDLGDPDMTLRLAAMRTHCMGGRGFTYRLLPRDGTIEGDAVAYEGKPTIVVDPASARLLGDVKVDYVEGFEGGGFAFLNSKATGRCPCGHHDLLG